MKLVELIKQYLSNQKIPAEVPDGYCPNCWGNQEYEGQFYSAIQNKGMDINEVSEQKGWIMDYAEKNLTGIQLKSKGQNIVCENCKVTYIPSE